MKGILMIRTLLFLCSIMLYSTVVGQVLTVDNCYIATLKDRNKTTLEFNEDALNSFVSSIKIPISVLEQKIEGHSFINIIIRYGKISESTVMIGIHQAIDTLLSTHFKKSNLKWYGDGTFDTVQKIIVSVKINYRNCTLENIEQNNLSCFKTENAQNIQRIEQFQSLYNNYNEIFYFDSTNNQYYKNRTPASISKSINKEIILIPWYHPEYIDKHILLDIDKNNIFNVILQHNDSVFILENNKLQFAEQGHLRFIRRLNNDIIVEMESICSSCNKTNRTLNFYKKEGNSYNNIATITSYSTHPQLLEKITFTKTVVTKHADVFVRSNPFNIDKPYNSCTGIVSEEFTCTFSKTWGNIFGVLQKGISMSVLQEFSDIAKKKWYYVILNRNDGLFLGWISDNDVEPLSLNPSTR